MELSQRIQGSHGTLHLLKKVIQTACKQCCPTAGGAGTEICPQFAILRLENASYWKGLLKSQGRETVLGV